MHQLLLFAPLMLGVSVVVPITLAQSAGSALAAAASASPSDSGARKTYVKAMKAFDEHKYGLALDGFRKADSQDGGHCVPCEMQAYKVAKQTQNFQAAREETTLLLDHVTSPDDKAEVHYLAGDVCLSEGDYRIFEKPFQEADSEFQAALQLQPEKSDCLYKDGVALAHLHQYQKAQGRFGQYMKLASPKDLQYSRAKLFAAQPELARKRVAPNFNVTALDRKTISMESLAGKVVLIDFWATWCGPCMKALPHLREIAHEFEGQPLVVISINLDEDETTWKNFVAHNAMTWLQYHDGGFEGPMATQFNVKAIPTTFTIDADGFVQDQQVGDGDIETKLKQLIAQASETGSRKRVAEVRESLGVALANLRSMS